MTHARLFVALAAAMSASTVFAQDVKVEGVNPADLLTQVQVTTEYNRISNDVDQWLLVGKYDYKFEGTPAGLNVELPVAIHLNGPGFSETGVGDLFVRGRYIKSVGQWSFGGAMEVVAPIGSDAFTAGRWQTNPAVLGVYAWNQQDITAVVHKRVYGYIEGDDDFADINQYQWRALQIHIFPTGWFTQADVARWRDVRTDAEWFDTRLSVGRQLSGGSRIQGELKRLIGDRENDVAFSLSYAVKL